MWDRPSQTVTCAMRESDDHRTRPASSNHRDYWRGSVVSRTDTLSRLGSNRSIVQLSAVHRIGAHKKSLRSSSS